MCWEEWHSCADKNANLLFENQPRPRVSEIPKQELWDAFPSLECCCTPEQCSLRGCTLTWIKLPSFRWGVHSPCQPEKRTHLEKICFCLEKRSIIAWGEGNCVCSILTIWRKQVLMANEALIRSTVFCSAERNLQGAGRVLHKKGWKSRGRRHRETALHFIVCVLFLIILFRLFLLFFFFCKAKKNGTREKYLIAGSDVCCEGPGLWKLNPWCFYVHLLKYIWATC